MLRTWNTGEWALLDQFGLDAVSFTSFISMTVRDGGDVLSYPVEEGGFIHYNKTQSPLDISLTLAVQGDEADFEYILQRLAQYKNNAVTLTVVTPAAVYMNMTLRSVNNSRSRESGAGMLVVELSLVEVREAGNLLGVSLSVITQPFNPTSATRINTGRALPFKATDAVLAALGRGKSYF